MNCDYKRNKSSSLDNVHIALDLLVIVLQPYSHHKYLKYSSQYLIIAFSHSPLTHPLTSNLCCYSWHHPLFDAFAIEFPCLVGNAISMSISKRFFSYANISVQLEDMKFGLMPSPQSYTDPSTASTTPSSTTPNSRKNSCNNNSINMSINSLNATSDFNQWVFFDLNNRKILNDTILNNKLM